MLTELLGLNHYIAMGKRARSRARDLKTRISATEEILEANYDDVSKEALAELKKEETASKKRVKELAAAVKGADELNAGSIDLVAKRDELEACGSELADGVEELSRIQDGVGGAGNAKKNSKRISPRGRRH